MSYLGDASLLQTLEDLLLLLTVLTSDRSSVMRVNVVVVAVAGHGQIVVVADVAVVVVIIDDTITIVGKR